MAEFESVNIGGVDLKIPSKGFASEETLDRLTRALTGTSPNKGLAGLGETADKTGKSN